MREYIHAGDAFQVVLSQRFERPVDMSAFSIYRGLRAVNPSPYMYYISFRDFEVVGLEPGAARHSGRSAWRRLGR